MASQLQTVPETSPTPGPAPEQPRLLGRSRPYTLADIPDRLRTWHAPRINRWERLHVTAGTLAVEFLRASGATRTALRAGEVDWIAPGTRWRVTGIDAETRFALEVHADIRGQAEAPQPLRTTLLDTAARRRFTDATALAGFIDALHASERWIVEGHFPVTPAAALPVRTHTCFWHPLHAGPNGFTALVARGTERFDLAEYLGRDHAVIEAALGRALAGNREGTRWLRATLERHLRIEESLIFPAWATAGGRQAWIDGLKHEHVYLRQYVTELDLAASRRKFLRLLDGHDEKEERVIYPDVLALVGPRATVLLDAAIGFPSPRVV